MATLFPWNAFLNAFAYFAHSLKGTPYEYSFMSYVSTAYTLVLLAMMIGLVIFRLDHSISLRWKGILGLGIDLLLIAMMSLLPMLEVLSGKPVIGQMAFFWAVLTIVSGTAVATGLMMKSFYTLISLYPAKYVPAFNGGQAVAGVLVSTVSLATEFMKAQGGNDAVMLKSVVVYFSSSALVLAMALGAFLWLSRQIGFYEAEMKATGQPGSVRQNLFIFKTGTIFIWDLAVGVMMMMTVTIAIITSYITSAKTSSASQLWAALYLPTIFLVYNIGDVIGRWLPAFRVFTFNSRSRKPLSLPWLRLIVFLPLFLMSNMRGKPESLRAILPTLVKMDWLYILIVLFFGISNGYICTLLMMIAPEQTQRRFLEKPTDDLDVLEPIKGHSGTIMGLFINIGLVCGSLGSFVLRALM